MPRCYVIRVDKKRTVALEDVVVAHTLHDGSESGAYFGAYEAVVVDVIHRDIVLPRLGIEEIVYRNDDVLAADRLVVNGDGDVFLLLRTVVYEFVEAFSQCRVILDGYVNRRNDDAEDERPIHERGQQGDGKAEIVGVNAKKEVAKSDKQYHGEKPNAHRKYRPLADKTTGKLRARKRKQRMTSECYSTEACCHGRLVALVEVEPERLHHVKQTEHDYCRQDRASYSVSVCIERIFSL